MPTDASSKGMNPEFGSGKGKKGKLTSNQKMVSHNRNRKRTSLGFKQREADIEDFLRIETGVTTVGAGGHEQGLACGKQKTAA